MKFGAPKERKKKTQWNTWGVKEVWSNSKRRKPK